MLDDRLIAELKRYQQSHLIAFWNTLNPTERKTLESQLRSIDFAQVERLRKGHDESPDWAALSARAEPPPSIRLPESASDMAYFEQREEAIALGNQALRSSKLAMILVAGGQGTRLGFNLPKGMFRIGPLSNRTLFEMHVDRLRAMMKEYHVSIPLYIMTSPATDARTRTFFSENDCFGLGSDQLRIFCQGTMPAIDAETGQILLGAPGEVSLSPDGHGGMLQAMSVHGCLDDAADQGIEHFFYGQVDNPLVEICDPFLIGHHIRANSDMTSQVVPKKTPIDRVGNVVTVDGRLQVIEYSDLPESAGKQVNRDGSLKLWAGNIAVHVFRHRFLDRVQHSVEGLPFHRARKAVPHVDEHGKLVEPKQPNAIKFERFIFDLLPLAERGLVVEGDAACVFAPVKNADGAPNETPASTKQAISTLHRSWLRAAGAALDENNIVEIHPNWALNAEAVAKKISPGLPIAADTYFI